MEIVLYNLRFLILTILSILNQYTRKHTCLLIKIERYVYILKSFSFIEKYALLFSRFVSYLSKFSSLLHVSEFNTLPDFSVWEAMCILIATNIKFFSNATKTSRANNDKYCFANSSLLF